jgi:hypothetical protein
MKDDEFKKLRERGRVQEGQTHLFEWEEEKGRKLLICSLCGYKMLVNKNILDHCRSMYLNLPEKESVLKFFEEEGKTGKCHSNEFLFKKLVSL